MLEIRLDIIGIVSYDSISSYNNLPVKLLGYPADTNLGFTKDALYQYETGEKITSAHDRYFLFDAYSAGGFSGGPVIRTSDNYIVGVNFGTKTSFELPAAVRITPEMCQIIADHR